MNSLNNSNATITTNNNNSISNVPNETVSMLHVIPMVSYRKEPVTIGSPLVKMFGANDKDTSKSIRNASCYKSKVLSSWSTHAFFHKISLKHSTSAYF